MNNIISRSYSFIIFTILMGFGSLSLWSCGGSSSVVLYLDSIEILQDIDSQSGFADDDELEIHLMDESAEVFIACLDKNQEKVMGYMRMDMIYANMEAIFRSLNYRALADDTPVTLRLVNKNNQEGDCASSYNDSGSGFQDPAGHLVAEVQLNYGDLFTGAVDFNGYATAKFVKDVSKTNIITVEEDFDGGYLALNQFFLRDEEFNDDEHSRPELALYLANYSTFKMVGCIDLEVLEAGGARFADLQYFFYDENSQLLNLDDLDGEYWIVLAELDGARCPDPESLSGPEKDILATSGLVTKEDLLETIELDNGFGSIELFLKEDVNATP